MIVEVLVGAGATVLLVAWRVRVARRRTFAVIGALRALEWVRSRDISEMTGVPLHAVYPIMSMLEDDGLVESQDRPGPPERGGRPVRVYRLTMEGIRS